MQRTNSGGRSRFRTFVGTWVLVCLLACVALIVRFSLLLPGSPPEEVNPEDPDDEAGHLQFRAYDGAASARGDSEGGEQASGPSETDVADDARLTHEIAAEDVDSAAVKQESGGKEVVAAAAGETVTRHKVPVPDDADLTVADEGPDTAVWLQDWASAVELHSFGSDPEWRARPVLCAVERHGVAEHLRTQLQRRCMHHRRGTGMLVWMDVPA